LVPRQGADERVDARLLVSVRASPVGGEIVAEFEENRQLWNFTISEIKLAGTCCFLRI
jgi:hypothetical protein